MLRRTGTMIVIQRCVEGLLITADKRAVDRYPCLENRVDDTVEKIRLLGGSIGFCAAGTAEFFDVKSREVKFSVEKCVSSFLRDRTSLTESDLGDVPQYMDEKLKEFLVSSPLNLLNESDYGAGSSRLFNFVLFYFDQLPRIHQFEMHFDEIGKFGTVTRELSGIIDFVGGQRTMKRLFEGNDSEFDHHRTQLDVVRVRMGATRTAKECTAFAERAIEIASEYEYSNELSTISTTSDSVLLTNDGRIEKNFYSSTPVRDPSVQ